MNLQISQMREKIREAYSGDGWAKRVRNMPNDQVIAAPALRIRRV